MSFMVNYKMPLQVYVKNSVKFFTEYNREKELKGNSRVVKYFGLSCEKRMQTAFKNSKRKN